MTQQLLNGADVVPRLEKVSRERMTERMARHALPSPRLDCRGVLRGRVGETNIAART